MNSPCSQIPHSYVAVATTADKQIAPRHHCPHTHNVPLQRLLVVTNGVKDMDLCVVECNYDVLVGQM